jgi:hypothetical protein
MRNQQYTVCAVKAIPYLTNEKYPLEIAALEI